MGDEGGELEFYRAAVHQVENQLDRKKKKEYEDSTPITEVVLKFICIFLMIITFPLALIYSIKVIQEYERATLWRIGRAIPGILKPGLVLIIPCIDELKKSDLRTVVVDVKPQNVMSLDSVSVNVDAVIWFRITDASKAAYMGNCAYSTGLLGQTTLREILGTYTLAEMLAKRKEITTSMKRIFDKRTRGWGLVVERVELKNLKIPKDMQRAMAIEAESAKEARAQCIIAEAEQKAAFALKEAAAVINESPAALQLRNLQTMAQVSHNKQSTILFPIPIDICGISNMV